jgi:hypothetical protein
MKKLTAAAILSFCFVSATAQISKGQWLVGGHGNFYANEQGSFESTSYTIAPNVGYFVLDKLGAGLRTELYGSVLNDSETGERLIKSFSYSASPFVRYYVLPQTKKINPFADVEYYIRRYRSVGHPNNVFKQTMFGPKLSGGVAFFVHTTVALEGIVTYRKYTYNEEGAGQSGSRALEVKIGFQVHL